MKGKKKIQLRYVYGSGKCDNYYTHPTLMICAYRLYEPDPWVDARVLGNRIMTIRGQCDKDQRVQYPYGITVEEIPMGSLFDEINMALKLLNKIVDERACRYGFGYRGVLAALKKMGAQRFVHVVDAKIGGAWVPWKYRDRAKEWVAAVENGKKLPSVKRFRKKLKALESKEV